MLSALLMLRRFGRVLRHAAREEEFLPVAGAAAGLVATGTIAYVVAEDWHVVDALYFAVATLTTTSVSDPELVLTDHWIKLFTIFFQLIGIGLLVEILRRLALSAVAVIRAEKSREARPQP